MLSKIKRAVKNPLEILPYFIVLSKRAQVKQIKKDGQVFYRYRGTLYPEYLNKGNAMSFILDKARKYCRGKGIDIGAGNFPFPGAVLIENNKDQNAYKLDNFLEGSLDYVFSSHCLEHLKRWQDALKLWSSKLKIGGILFLYLPHESMQLWRPWGPWVFTSHKWIPTYKVINAFLADNGMEVIDYDPEKDMYWSFYIAARKIK